MFSQHKCTYKCKRPKIYIQILRYKLYIPMYTYKCRHIKIDMKIYIHIHLTLLDYILKKNQQDRRESVYLGKKTVTFYRANKSVLHNTYKKKHTDFYRFKVL